MPSNHPLKQITTPITHLPNPPQLTHSTTHPKTITITIAIPITKPYYLLYTTPSTHYPPPFTHSPTHPLIPNENQQPTPPIQKK